MSLLQIIPNIFYEDARAGLDLFVDGLGFERVYESTEGEPFYILKRDGVTLHMSENRQLASEHRPEIRIETDDIESVYNQVKSVKPELLHPNLNEIKLQPWGLKEFALLDKTTVCVIIQQR